MRGRDRQLAGSGTRKHNHGTEHGGELAALGGRCFEQFLFRGNVTNSVSKTPAFFERPFTKISLQSSFYHLNLKSIERPEYRDGARSIATHSSLSVMS
jgi:hypothetical protein